MWFAILASTEVKKYKPIGVVRFGQDLVLWRDEKGKVNAINDFCVHRRARLSAGKMENGRLQCPFHGFEYDGNGRVKFIPAFGRSYNVPERFSVKAYNVAEKAGMVWMWFGDGEPRGEPRFFEDIDEKFVYAEIREIWSVPFPRAVENQLDVIHLPFVHRSTIGRGNRTLVNGPVVKWIDQDSFFFYVFNEIDRGQIAKKPQELEGLESRVYLEFIFPNVWQNHIAEGVRVVAFFVPVNNEKTMIYLRFYMRALSIRPIDWLIAKIGMQFNKVVLHQDRRVVKTQQNDIRKDNLVQGDLPIMEFRKRLYKEKKLVEFLFG